MGQKGKGVERGKMGEGHNPSARRNSHLRSQGLARPARRRVRPAPRTRDGTGGEAGAAGSNVHALQGTDLAATAVPGGAHGDGEGGPPNEADGGARCLTYRGRRAPRQGRHTTGALLARRRRRRRAAAGRRRRRRGRKPHRSRGGGPCRRGVTTHASASRGQPDPRSPLSPPC